MCLTWLITPPTIPQHTGRVIRNLDLAGDKIWPAHGKRTAGNVDRDGDEKRVLAYVMEHPGCERHRMQSMLDLPKWRVAEALSRLRENGQIELRQANNVRRWYAVSDGL